MTATTLIGAVGFPALCGAAAALIWLYDRTARRRNKP